MPDLDTTGIDLPDEPTAVPTLAEMTAELVAAYVAKNAVRAADIPALITSVHAALAGLGQPPAPEAAVEPLVPAVSIRKSVTDDFIVSLEDGRKFRSLKRYLGTLGLTPDEYRAKWGLPKDYPMVAPGYSARRSALAKTIGLGRKRADEPLSEPDEVLEPAKVPEMRKSGEL